MSVTRHRGIMKAAAIALAAAAVGMTACRPGSITEARDQLQRGGERSFVLRLPVTIDTVLMTDFLPEDRDTAIGNISGVRADPQSFVVPVVAGFRVPIEFLPEDVDFGEFEDAMRDAVINAGKSRLILGNDSAQAVVLASMVVGIVELNPDGSVPLDGGGNPRYDTTAAGVPRSMPIEDAPGSGTVTVSGNTIDTLDFDAPILLDGLIDLLLDGKRAAILISGDGRGGGSPSSVLSGGIESVILLDITIPSAGVSFASSTQQDGAEFEPEDADQVTDRLALASFSLSVENGAPFAVVADIAFAEGDFGDTDLFASPPPGTIVLDSIALAGTTVDATGQVTGPVTDSITIALTGQQVRPLLGERFTARSRIRLVPAQGGGGRAVIRPADVIAFRARVEITIQSGGSP